MKLRTTYLIIAILTFSLIISCDEETTTPQVVEEIGPCPGTPTVEYEGKTYNTVKIGSQCWLKENLDVGTMIQENQNSSNNGVIEKYCYDDNPANCITYGGLYQWDEVMQYVSSEGVQGICPPGWHIPTKTEYETLIATVNNDGNALKKIGQGSSIGVGTNYSGFSALLAGFRYSDGVYAQLGEGSAFWSSTESDIERARTMYLMDITYTIYQQSSGKKAGFCVRCIKD